MHEQVQVVTVNPWLNAALPSATYSFMLRSFCMCVLSLQDPSLDAGVALSTCSFMVQPFCGCQLSLQDSWLNAGIAPVYPELDGAVLLQRPCGEHGQARVASQRQHSIAVPLALLFSALPAGDLLRMLRRTKMQSGQLSHLLRSQSALSIWWHKAMQPQFSAD